MPEKWRLLDLGALNGYAIQSVYESVAKSVGEGKSPNTLILCYPSDPYVCIGVHQIVFKEVDVEYCTTHGIPIVRRRQGGGAVYLDDGQQFYHLIVKSKGMMDVEGFYRKYLQPTVYVYRKYELNAEYRPINDVVVNGKKASGNAAETIGGADILIGNVIMDIDPRKLVSVLRVPDEKFRDKLASSMELWLTSLKKELGYVPPREEVKEYLIEGYEKTLKIELEPVSLTEDEKEEWARLIEEFRSDRWTYKKEFEHERLLEIITGKCTKVSEDVQVCEATCKAEKLLRIIIEVSKGRITDVVISGDFFMEPYTALRLLEEELVGAKLERDELSEKVKSFFEKAGVRLVGAKPEDLVEALMKASERPHL